MTWMRRSLRSRFWAESLLALTTAILTALTLLDPEWIEAVFGVEPDAGSGALEWAIVAVSLVATLGFAALARAEWRRAAAGVA